MPRSLILLLLAAAPVAAQQSSGGAVATTRALWNTVTGYLVKSAEQMPESLYAFRPTPEVRTFGQLIGHVAGAQQMLCANALGDPAPAEDAVEQAKTTKADLVAALKASQQYCNRAYAQSDADAQAAATVFGQPQTRLFALMMNMSHNNEHYGNVVTYLRIKGMVPPSSARGG